MFILTTTKEDEEGAFSVSDRTGHRVLYIFEQEDDALRYSMMFDDEGLQILLKQYVKGEMSKEAISGHIQDQFDRDYNNEMIYNFYGLFPKALNSTPVKYEGSEALKATVLFTFDRYSAGKYSSYDRYRGAYNNIRDENAMRRIETKAIADDSGLSQKEAAIIQAGGFVETVIE